MNVKQCDDWLKSRLDVFLDVIRIYLGVGLLVKGIFFLLHPEQLNGVAQGSAWAGLVPLVPYVHMVGGLLLAVGLQVRLAALAQLPVLACAVFLVNLPRVDHLIGREGFEFSALVLFLLVVILFKGAGWLSLSHRWKRNTATGGYARWVDAHSDVFLDAIRIYLGIGLIVKGLYIMTNRDQVLALLDAGGGLSLAVMTAAHLVIPIHFAGGLLLALGLVTRPAALLQIPVVAGALICVYLPRLASLEMRENIEFSGLVLFLLFVIAAHGPGRCSVDHLIDQESESSPTPEPAR
jgi:uncharacterized membrane protein YphA (DoxX/SURF4 family)